MKSYGTIAIVGRPNVGKSTLFNRLTRSQSAYYDTPGATRDCLMKVVTLDEQRHCWIVDSGGYEGKDASFQPFGEDIVWQQTEKAIDACDLVVFLVDGHTGVHAHDRLIWKSLHKRGKKFLTVVNKVEGAKSEVPIWEFCSLNAGGEPIAISAAHNRGIRELKQALSDQLLSLSASGSKKITAQTDTMTKIAIVGRPNAGKSSLLNRLAGEQRSIVSDYAGTTRDAVDEVITHFGRPFKVVDTLVYGANQK